MDDTSFVKKYIKYYPKDTVLIISKTYVISAYGKNANDFTIKL